MIGTIVNVGAIVIGCIVGSLLRERLAETYRLVIMQVLGLVALGVGIVNIVTYMPHSHYPVLCIVSLCLGSLLGTWWKIDDIFQKITNRFSHSALGEGLSTAIVLFCIGTLSILGPIKSAVEGDPTFLYTNATMDLVASTIFAASYGIGIIFASVVLFCWQGALYTIALYAASFLSPPWMTEWSILGGYMLLASGLSMLHLVPVKTMNLLPSLLVPPVWLFLVWLGGMG